MHWMNHLLLIQLPVSLTKIVLSLSWLSWSCLRVRPILLTCDPLAHHVGGLQCCPRKNFSCTSFSGKSIRRVTIRGWCGPIHVSNKLAVQFLLELILDNFWTMWNWVLPWIKIKSFFGCIYFLDFWNQIFEFTRYWSALAFNYFSPRKKVYLLYSK